MYDTQSSSAIALVFKGRLGSVALNRHRRRRVECASFGYFPGQAGKVTRATARNPGRIRGVQNLQLRPTIWHIAFQRSFIRNQERSCLPAFRRPAARRIQAALARAEHRRQVSSFRAAGWVADERRHRPRKPMRLTTNQRTAIREEVTRIFGQNARVRLFGSRVDDKALGGDIDLHIETSGQPEELLDRELRLHARLLRRLGERRIDIVVYAANSRYVLRRTARQTECPMSPIGAAAGTDYGACRQEDRHLVGVGNACLETTAP